MRRVRPQSGDAKNGIARQGIDLFRERGWARWPVSGARRAPTEPLYQAVAVAASVMPWASSQRSASIAALQPSPAAVTAWR